MKRLTATQAIKQECRYCLNKPTISGPVGCYNDSCQLNKLDVKVLKRIKAHCIECNPQQSAQGARACDGKVLNPVPHDCPLHPYRLGHNPILKGKRGKSISDMAMLRGKRLIQGPSLRQKSLFDEGEGVTVGAGDA